MLAIECLTPKPRAVAFAMDPNNRDPCGTIIRPRNAHRSDNRGFYRIARMRDPGTGSTRQPPFQGRPCRQVLCEYRQRQQESRRGEKAERMEDRSNDLLQL